MSKISNKVTLIGNLGQDPEVRNLDNGNTIAKFSIATNEKYTNKAGEAIEQTEWHNCVMFGKGAEVFAQYTKKGEQVAVEGKLRHRKYDDSEGVTRYVTEIEVREFVFLGKRNTTNDQPEKRRENVPF